MDPQCVAVVEMMQQSGRPQVHQVSVEEARANYRQTPIVLGGKTEQVASIEDRLIESDGLSIPTRIYKPEGENLPILVFYHGGGFVIGDLETHDKLCRSLTRRTGCMTIAIDYRLAPEHPFPAAVEDCVAALNWVAAHAAELGGDASRIAVAGDSAGGNLSAVAALLARDNGGPALKMQLLIYPGTAAARDSASHANMPNAPILPKEVMEYFHNQYLGTTERVEDIRFAPLSANDHSNLPPAEIIVAGFDPLRDEGVAYGEKLKAAGGQTNVTNYGGMIHAFVQMPGAIAVGDQAIDQCASALRRAFRE